MKKSGVRVYVLIAILGILLIISGGSIYLKNSQITSSPNSVTTSTGASITTSILSSSTPTVKIQKTILQPTFQLSSSTVQVGDFTIVVNCKNNNPFKVEIRKNMEPVQTLAVDATMTGIPECVEAKNQDINFDGYPDFMVQTDNGSGGTSYSYWLFSTSTQEFYCPEINSDCSLMNPTFDIASKKVTSIDPMGAGSTNIKTYGIVDGKLVLISNVNKSY